MILIILILITGISIGFFSAWVLKRENARQKISNDPDNRERGFKKINQERRRIKEERKEKIIRFMREKERITNDEVEEILDVSDSTATNYLDELEKEGKIVQKGRVGRNVFYIFR